MILRTVSFLAVIACLVGCGGGSYQSEKGSSDNQSQDGCPGPNCVADAPPQDLTPIPPNAIMVSNATELTAALQSAVGGETIALASGDYGQYTINGRMYPSMVVIRPQQNASPVFKSIHIQNSRFIQISGVSVLPRVASGDNVSTAVSISGQDIVFEKSMVNYIDDSSSWVASNWLNHARDGVGVSGTRITVRENVIKNIAFALSVDATNSLISRNKIDGFRGDGMRGLGDGTVFEYNDVRNCRQVDDNHMDGFQSWSNGPGGPGSGVVTGIVLRGNYFLESDTPNPIVTCNLQAIGLFDGMFKDWVVENNVVVVNHWHAISFYGAINVKIANNTVIDPNLTDNIRPWIMITSHKNGTSSQNSIIRNNIAPTIDPGSGSTADHNLVSNAGNLSQIFANPVSLDYRLKLGSIAIDAGSSVNPPLLDFLGMSRPVGAGIDIGAHEYR
ncbi:MAG TPA: choice-of-anchor Q domain-containing protein [Nitrospira sp.]|nr:choice-of-anchor Q domain-containing protein [Nitrospira sp.]